MQSEFENVIGVLKSVIKPDAPQISNFPCGTIVLTFLNEQLRPHLFNSLIYAHFWTENKVGRTGKNKKSFSEISDYYEIGVFVYTLALDFLFLLWETFLTVRKFGLKSLVMQALQICLIMENVFI